MRETFNYIQLIAEHYDVHPQPVIWMRPLFKPGTGEIIDFAYSYSNEEGLKYLNLSREQFAGLSLSTSPALAGELRQNILAEMTAVFQTGIKCETNVFNKAIGKHARVLRSKLHDGVLTVIQDITQEKHLISQLQEQAEQLKDQKSLLDNILKNSSNGISVSRVQRNEAGEVFDATTILANDAAIKYIGLPKEIYLTKRATEIEPAIVGSPYYKACIETLQTGEPFVMQYQMQSTGKWLELTVSKMDADHLIHIFTDVTPIKEVQIELEKAAAMLKSVFNSAQTGMLTCAPEHDEKNDVVDFRFTMVNSTVSGYVGQTPGELEGERVSRWFPEYFTNGLFEMYKDTFETGNPHRREAYYNLEGHDNYLDIQTVKIANLLLVTLSDYTSLRKSQLQLEQLVKALERSNTYLEEFAYAASHDLKEPIRKILNFAVRLKIALGPRMTENEADLFEKIENASNRMQLLIDDLLEFSHVSENTIHLEPVDLNEKVQKVLADLELAIEEKQAQVIIQDKLPTVKGNRRQLQQLFQNLIGNALKYSKRDVSPEIIITASKQYGDKIVLNHHQLSADRQFYLFKIKDNGIGFEQKHAEKIFEVFKRLHGRSEYSGTGIGLSIARKVVENHQGFIWAEGEPGKGATFYVVLPAD